MKYNDIIQLQDYFHPVFNLQNETEGYWRQFVPTSQFYDLLGTALDAVTSTVSAKRKSLWVQGTFGTGKSHAGSVIRHLFCDDAVEAEQYISEHVESAEHAARLRKLRAEKRFFPVVLSGVQGAYNPRTFAITVQRSIKEALKAKKINIAVSSDFELAIEKLDGNKMIQMDEILPHAPDLRALAKNKTEIIRKLKEFDIDVLLTLEEALAKYDISFSNDKKLTNWLSEVETELRKQEKADGLFIFWDEFTSVMDTISSGLTNMVQSIAELSEKLNVFLYLISHRLTTALAGERGDDVRKMNDRFHIIHYKMEANTTYRLMSATMKVSKREQYDEIRNSSFPDFKELISYLTDGTGNIEKEIHDLFPLHPYTAFLCSMISGQIGSSNRSVFRFLYDEEKGFLNFLKTNNADGGLLTADKLWDFFLDDFSDDKYGAIMGTFNTHAAITRNHSAVAEKVFKGVLLLNALRNVLDNERVIPSQQNILRMFSVEFKGADIQVALDFLNQKQIVQKDPSDNFIISLSALPPIEIDKERGNQRSQFSDAVKVLESSDSAKYELNVHFRIALTRECELVFIPASADETRIKSMLQKGFQKKHTLCLALIFAKNNTEHQPTAPLLAKLSQAHTDIAFVLFDEVLDSDGLQYERFISYLATSIVAGRHMDNEQQRMNRENAGRVVTNWTNRLKNGNYRLYFRGGDEHQGVFSNLAKYINEQVTCRIFTAGADALRSMRNKPEAFWKPKGAKKVAEVVIVTGNRDEIARKLPGVDKPAEFLLKDMDGDDFIVDNTMRLKGDAPEAHPLPLVANEVKKLLRQVQRDNRVNFNLGQTLRPLAEKPFGLYGNAASYFLLAFALKPFLEELYDDDLGTPLTTDTLRDKIDIIFKFWEDRAQENKLRVRFGSREEKKLLEFLIKAFALNPNIESSIKNVRWEIMRVLKEKFGKPFWCLKYHNDAKPEIKDAINQLSALLQTAEIKPEAIDKLWHTLEPIKFDFGNLIKIQNAFADSFWNFVKAEKDVQIEDVWRGELETYLVKNLNEEVGNWTEETVRGKIPLFYIQKTRKMETTTAPQTYPTINNPASQPQAAESQARVGSANTARTSTVPQPQVAEPPVPSLIENVEKQIEAASLDSLKRLLRKLLKERQDLADWLNNEL
jgi:hypothetical protein